MVVLLAAHNEAERIADTLSALAEAFPVATVWVADDGSTDATAEIARAAGAQVERCERVLGKGAAMTRAARSALRQLSERETRQTSGREEPVDGEPVDGETVFVLCDGDLASSAARLGPLADCVARGEADVAVAIFATSVGGGLGIALGFARWAIERRCGLRMRAPISGQRALTHDALVQVLPFARGYGMEMGMTIDAVRGGFGVREIELDLAHRASGRTLRGFLHRGRQLVDFLRVFLDRR